MSGRVRARRPPVSLLFLVVRVFDLFVVFFVFFAHWGKFERLSGDHFEFRPAFTTGDDVPAFEVFLVEIEIGFTFRT